jgi:ketosteroid isomerase-like protein
MSEEKIEVIRAFARAWNAGDMDAFRELHDPDVILRTEKDWPEPGPYVGREAVIGFFQRARDTFDADTIELTGDFTHAADRFVVRWIWHGQGHGPASNMEFTSIFTVRDGKAREIEYFWDHAEALEAAGLSE